MLYLLQPLTLMLNVEKSQERWSFCFQLKVG